jgi:hypothetical protein
MQRVEVSDFAIGHLQTKWAASLVSPLPCSIRLRIGNQQEWILLEEIEFPCLRLGGLCSLEKIGGSWGTGWYDGLR